MPKLPEEKRAAILDDLKQGRGCDEIARRQGVGRQTVYSMREANRDALPDWKRRTARRMMETASELVEKVRDDVAAGAGNLQQKSISLGILIDKAGQLRSEPQQIVEHRLEMGASIGGWLAESKQSAALERTKAADVVEIGETPAGGNG